MSNPTTLNLKEIFSIVESAQQKLKSLIAKNPNYFNGDAVTQKIIEEVVTQKHSSFNLGLFDKEPTNQQIMRCVDLTILDKNAKDSEIIAVATRAAKENCATVCVYPQHIHIVKQVMAELKVKDVPPIAVVGFPFVADGSPSTTKKTVEETLNAIASGAQEIDMVLPLNFRETDTDYQVHFNYIKAVVDAAHSKKVPVKVILETAYLSDEQIALASMISKIAGADWVKTSTGFAELDKFSVGRTADEKGATPKSVAIMRLAVGHYSLNEKLEHKKMGVKASGGVRNKEQALAVIYAGADRIGASSGISLEATPTTNSKPSY